MIPSERVLFEPWGLGDATIALSVARHSTQPWSLGCASRWHPLLKAIAPEARLIACDLPYTTRSKKGPFDLGDALPRARHSAEVLSIRGDLRDMWAARRIFSGARVRFSGFGGWFLRRVPGTRALADLRIYDVTNRYLRWAKLLGVPMEKLEPPQRRLDEASRESDEWIIHVGAQWKSRQYPDTRNLVDSLRALGKRVALIAGPGDGAPPGIQEDEIERPEGPALIPRLRSAALVITNDSGPMHLAAAAGARVAVIARISDIEEWAPPGAIRLESPAMPRGYRPDAAYCSDSQVDGWITVDRILAQLKARLGTQ